MSQLSFSEFASKRKVTRREQFLAQMERAIPWKVFADRVEPHYPKAGKGRRPYPSEVMLRIHFMLQGLACRIRQWKKPCTTAIRFVDSPGCRWPETVFPTRRQS